MADGAGAINKALAKNFPKTIKLMCYFHLLKNVRKHLQKKLLKPLTGYILWWIELLFKTTDIDVFYDLFDLIKTETPIFVNTKYTDEINDSGNNLQIVNYQNNSKIFQKITMLKNFKQQILKQNKKILKKQL